jgi:hypothetical protein
MADQPKVVSTSEDAMLNDARQYVPAIRVQFVIGTDGPFYLKIPKSDFTAARVNEEINKFAAEHARLQR